MNSISKKIWLLLILIGCSSCAPAIGKMFPGRAFSEYRPDKDTSSEFKQGWDDGCEVGMASAGNTFYKVFHNVHKVDGYKMVNSSDYSSAWNLAFWYCFRHDYIKQKSAIWGGYFSGYR
jgi:hypothetical protein